MAELASYIFKPKHGPELAMKVINRFCDDFLHYDHEGFYLHWRTSKSIKASGMGTRRPLPEGFVEFTIETDAGNLEAWSETCYSERELEAGDLTESFYALLPEDFWYTDEEGKAEYHFYERELAEVVAGLSDDDSRIVSFGAGRQAWVRGTASEKKQFETVDLLDYTLTVPIVKEKPRGTQLELTL